LGQLVGNDAVAAAGIELLKQNGLDERRSYPQQNSATAILPTIALRYADGFIDYAINLIESDRRYRDVFAYVFGSTVILKH